MTHVATLLCAFALDALLLLLHIAILVGGEFALDKFTWPDILARFGGLNSNPDNQPTTIIYSPTIHAADATGVDQVLQEDKKRLDKWYEEKKMRDQVEVYS